MATAAKVKTQPKPPPTMKPAKVTPTRPVSIRIPMELAKRLRMRAAAEDKSVTEVVIATLERYVKPVSAAETK